jgi:hypothetical protein
MRFRLLVAAAAVTAFPLMLGGVAASAASTVPAPPARTAPVTQAVQAAPVGSAIPEQAYDNCHTGYYCDYADTSGSNTCLVDNVTDESWMGAGCRNVDESFANRTSGLVRLYYSPDLQGAWVCIDASKYSNNLAGYVFNNGGSGKAGYGAPLENDVASSETASGNCSNPLPWP